MINAIQYYTICKSDQEAEQSLEAWRTQDGFISGRIIRDNKIQVFFNDFIGELPDGCRRVLLPNNLI